MSLKPVIVSIEVTDEPEGIVIILQQSKREQDKITVWLKDYKFGDLTLEEVTKLVSEHLLNILKRAGYEHRRIPRVGDRVVFKHDMVDVSAGDDGVIIGIEPDRPYAYLIKVIDKDIEVFARLEDFELKTDNIDDKSDK